MIEIHSRILQRLRCIPQPYSTFHFSIIHLSHRLLLIDFGALRERDLHLFQIRDTRLIIFPNVALVWMCVALETCVGKLVSASVQHRTGTRQDEHLSLARRSSRSRFFGNMPRTARLRISPPPHLVINRAMDISCKLPGRVECE